MNLFFHMALGLNDFDGANPLFGPLEGVGPENIDFCWPKWHMLRSLPFQDQKCLNFQGPPLQMALIMDFPQSI
jgi:hypothetical protein